MIIWSVHTLCWATSFESSAGTGRGEEESDILRRDASRGHCSDDFVVSEESMRRLEVGRNLSTLGKGRSMGSILVVIFTLRRDLSYKPIIN